MHRLLYVSLTVCIAYWIESGAGAAGGGYSTEERESQTAREGGKQKNHKKKERAGEGRTGGIREVGITRVG